jgi:hypothetical protein
MMESLSSSSKPRSGDVEADEAEREVLTSRWGRRERDMAAAAAGLERLLMVEVWMRRVKGGCCVRLLSF